MLLAVLFASLAFASPPSWVHQDSFKRVGDILTVVCSGTGPTLGIARNEAMEECRASAVNALGANFKVSSTTVQTNQESAFHEEVSSNQKFQNLNCKVEQEYNEETEGSVRDYLKCRFDLARVEVSEVDPPNTKMESDETDAVRNRAEVESISPSAKNSRKQNDTTDGRQVVLNSVPACDDLIIRGTLPRVVRCDQVPLSLVVYPGDEIIVRSKGYLPKHFFLKSKELENDIKPVWVYLEKL